MRISDWSSDVCSSDLLYNDVAGDDLGPKRRQSLHPITDCGLKCFGTFNVPKSDADRKWLSQRIASFLVLLLATDDSGRRRIGPRRPSFRPLAPPKAPAPYPTTVRGWPTGGRPVASKHSPS